MITKAIVEQFEKYPQEQRAVVVHCSFTLEEDCYFQLPVSATLYDHGTLHKSQMLHKEGLGVPCVSQLLIKG